MKTDVEFLIPLKTVHLTSISPSPLLQLPNYICTLRQSSHDLVTAFFGIICFKFCAEFLVFCHSRSPQAPFGAISSKAHVAFQKMTQFYPQSSPFFPILPFLTQQK